MKRIIVVGTGFSGAIIANKLASVFDVNIDVIERRNHIGGNMYDYEDKYGIRIQQYGPHFINTNKYWIIKYLSTLDEMVPYNCRLLSVIDNKYICLPFNFTSVQQLVGYEKSESLINLMREEFKGRDRVSMFELKQSVNLEVRNFAELLFDKAFKTYTSKQWGIPIEKIDSSVIDRVQFCLGYDIRYLNKDFQFLPRHGFTFLFNQLLHHPNIKLHLNEDACDNISFNDNNIFYKGEKVDYLIYTGAIDELFSYCFGNLPYRALRFDVQYFNCNKKQPVEILSFPQAPGYTRSTEYKYFSFDCIDTKHTVTVTEYPTNYEKNIPGKDIPCYPVITNESRVQYLKYLEKAQKINGLFLCGRLAEFKYYNMDDVIEHTFEIFESIKKEIENDLH